MVALPGTPKAMVGTNAPPSLALLELSDAIIDSLRQIKETEEKVQAEIEAHRKHVEQEIKNLQNNLKNAIDIAKQDGKKMVEKSIEESKNKAFY